MPKRMKRTKKASEATKNKVYNSYYNFIDFKGLDEYNPDFTLGDVVEWMANDSGATKGSDKYKVIAYVAVAMAKTWRNLGLTKKIDDNEYEAIDFNYDLGDGDSYDESEWKGVKDVDDSYFRDYGMRDMSFPKIDDSYDNYEESRRIRGKRMLREAWGDEKVKGIFKTTDTGPSWDVMLNHNWIIDDETKQKFEEELKRNGEVSNETIENEIEKYVNKVISNYDAFNFYLRNMAEYENSWADLISKDVRDALFKEGGKFNKKWNEETLKYYEEHKIPYKKYKNECMSQAKRIIDSNEPFRYFATTDEEKDFGNKYYSFDIINPKNGKPFGMFSGNLDIEGWANYFSDWINVDWNWIINYVFKYIFKTKTGMDVIENNIIENLTEVFKELINKLNKDIDKRNFDKFKIAHRVQKSRGDYDEDLYDDFEESRRIRGRKMFRQK